MSAIKTVPADMNVFSEKMVLEALTKNIPPAGDRNYKLGEEDLIYS